MVLDCYKLDGKTAVITGAAGLLGRKHTEAVVEAGGQVVALDINQSALDKLRADVLDRYEKEIIVKTCDISNVEEISQVASQINDLFGKYPEILINNAAIDSKFQSDTDHNPSRFEYFSLEQWNKEIAVGLSGAMLCSQVFGREMARHGGGVILNIASDLGVIAPDQRLYQQDGVADDEQNVKPVTYSVIKHGLIGLTKYLATYWADKNVRANAFAPGGVFNNHPDEFVNRLTSLIPMGRMANIDEYKAAIVFLCSDASSYMNGSILNMDGGRTAW